MVLFRLIPYYISWHYTQGVKDLLALWKTFLWFVPSFFSIGTLLRTLFSPFERLSERYRGGLDVEDFFSVVIVNLMMRLVGFCVRSFIIVFGVFSFAFTVVFGAISIVGWVLLPVLVVFLFVLSFFAFSNTL